MHFRGTVFVVHAALFVGLAYGCLAGWDSRAGTPEPSPLLWDSKSPALAQWNNPSGLACSTKDGQLVLEIHDTDSHITCESGLCLNTTPADAFLIRYRATHFTVARTSGEIFYTNREHGFAGDQYVVLPSLVLDGEWHDLFVRVAASFRGDINDWAGHGPVTALRFDLVNEAPGCIEIASILASAQLHPSSEDTVAMDSPVWYWFATDSLSPAADHCHERRIILPQGEYTVWAHIVDAPLSGEFLAAFDIPGAHLSIPRPGDTHTHAWHPMGTFVGRETMLRLSGAPSLFFDAVIFAQGACEPRDLPEPPPAPVHSTIQATAKPAAEATPMDKPVPPPTPGVAAAVPVSPADVPLESEVRLVNGMPQLFVNGKAVYPMIGNGEGGDKTCTRESYRRAGFNIEALWIDPMGADQWWRGPEDYHFEGVDSKLIADLDYNPDVWMLPIVWAAPPLWWQDLHPGETARFSDGNTWDYYKSTPSFGSAVWRHDAQAALTAFVKHIESMPYAPRILGYWVIGGVSAEWQGWGAHSSCENKRLMDYSQPAQEGFRRFLQTKYPTRAADFMHAEIPPYSERRQGEIGIFRDPAKAQMSIDYNEYYSESVADTLLSCVKAAKDAAGRKKIVGAYFGYLLEYANMGWCLQMGGHNALRKVLDSPDIDFLSAPPSYAIRRLGMPIGWMWPFRSIQTAGKLVWVDDDTRTFLSGECDYTPAVNLEQTQSMLRRNFGTALCRLCPQGFLQINSGHELDDPAIAADMRILRQCGEYAIANNVARRAEIAVVVDDDSRKYLAFDGENLPSGEIDRNIAWNGNVTLSPRNVNTVMGDLVGYQRDRIGRLGAPADWILFSDLPRRTMDYKLYIMLDCFQYSDEELQAIHDKLYASSATVVWCYAPGFIHDGTADVKHMEALTGFTLHRTDVPAPPRTNLVDFTTPFTNDPRIETSFGVDYAMDPLFHVVDDTAKTIGLYRANGLVSLAAKRIGRAQVLFCGSNKISARLLRKMAEAAGVHLYTGSLDPFEANDAFVMIHATRAGNKTLHLPQQTDLVDLFTGETATVQEGNVTIPMAEDSTRLFFTGDAKCYHPDRPQ